MANSNPTPKPENLQPPWQPGQSGNPAGYSARRRVTDALVKVIAEKGADHPLAMTWLAMALGDTAALKGRKPDFRFFKELLDRTEGKVPDKLAVVDEDPDDVDLEKLSVEERRVWLDLHRKARRTADESGAED